MEQHGERNLAGTWALPCLGGSVHGHSLSYSLAEPDLLSAPTLCEVKGGRWREAKDEAGEQVS